MLYGIGVDLVQISRMEKVIQRWGERFLRRVFTENELAVCSQRVKSASAFALRFAAKEAFAKALGLGMRQGVAWRDIEVFHHPGGRPGLRIHGTAFDICRKQHIHAVHVSLSDEGDYGVATVMLESGKRK
jgi:holo-[acyl-carrier protein] synthase